MANYFEHSSDVELWFLRDTDGQIPVLVVPGRMLKDQSLAWKVTPAMGLESDQQAWLVRHLNNLAFVKKPTFWLCKPDRAKSMMQKASGITPRRYLHWGNLAPKEDAIRIATDDPDEIEADMSTAANAFVVYAANNMGVRDLKFARLMWYHFCRSAVTWMTAKQMPLDMLFGRLRAFPYRKNWEQIMAAKYPGLLELCQLTPEERRRRLEGTSLQMHLALPEMAAMHTTSLFDWTVSIELRDDFYTTTRANEQAEFDRLGPARYYERWLRVVKSLYVGAVETLSAYFVQASWAVGDVDRSLPLHRRFLRSFLAKGRVRPAAPDAVDTDYILGARPTNGAIKRKGCQDNPKAFTVQEVPDEDLGLDVRSTG